jgi:hypothetical protein
MQVEQKVSVGVGLEIDLYESIRKWAVICSSTINTVDLSGRAV